jgi:hypothetical protein
MKKLILIIFFGSNSFAGGVHIGNGGIGFLCGNKKVVLLDIMEMKSPIEPTIANEVRSNAIKKILTNLVRLSPAIGRQYEKDFKDFEGSVDFRTDIELTETQDSLHVVSPKNCKIKQLAVRRKAADSLTNEFIIDKDLWEKMDENNKTALTLHEIVYRHLSKLGETNSINARKLTGYFLSQKAFADTPDQFWALIKELQLPIYQ